MDCTGRWNPSKADQEKWASRPVAVWLLKIPSFRGAYRRRIGPDHHRPAWSEPNLEIIADRMKRRIQRGSQRGQAPGCLPRNHSPSTVKDVDGKVRSPVRQQGQYEATSYLTLEPRNRQGLLSSSTKSKGAGVVPREYIPAVREGRDRTLTSGVLAGYPWWTSATFGSYPRCGLEQNGLQDGCHLWFLLKRAKANPSSREPMMAVEGKRPRLRRYRDGRPVSRRGMVQGAGRHGWRWQGHQG